VTISGRATRLVDTGPSPSRSGPRTCTPKLRRPSHRFDGRRGCGMFGGPRSLRTRLTNRPRQSGGPRSKVEVNDKNHSRNGEVAKRLGNGLQNRHTRVRIPSSPPGKKSGSSRTVRADSPPFAPPFAPPLDEATLKAAIDRLTRALATVDDEAIPDLVAERRALREEVSALRDRGG
jgi:hypothetical protein